MTVALLAAGCGPRWDFDYDFGKQRAINEKKPLLLFFTDLLSNDHYLMDKQVLSDPAVRAELESMVNVMLSHQWGPAPLRYNVRAPQLCILCKPDGTEVARLNAKPVPAPAEFLNWLRPARAAADPSPAGKAKASAATK
ncbi:MAG: hypothetical protein L6R00_14815 [Phycisphaerae bacterium]|nr:hypothetical protein [Phycisphaerae bacterium]